jgi:predicted nucleic acid-binding protein
MMKSEILIDTGFLIALNDLKDPFRDKAIAFAKTDTSKRLVPDVVLTEVTYLLKRHIGHHAVLTFLRAFAESPMELEAITKDDLKRASAIMTKYGDAKLDFVDCCIMALAERLEVASICTFDRRDFVIYRLPSGQALELLP